MERWPFLLVPGGGKAKHILCFSLTHVWRGQEGEQSRAPQENGGACWGERNKRKPSCSTNTFQGCRLPTSCRHHLSGDRADGSGLLPLTSKESGLIYTVYSCPLNPALEIKIKRQPPPLSSPPPPKAHRDAVSESRARFIFCKRPV